MIFSGIPVIVTLGLLCSHANSATLATDKKTKDALKWAVTTWEKAVQHHIEVPAIYHGEPLEDCGEDDDLACASPKLQVIVVVRKMHTRMLHSVLLHEVGHLLGLPDIEGDALMDPFQSRHIALKPTPIDIFWVELMNGWIHP